MSDESTSGAMRLLILASWFSVLEVFRPQNYNGETVFPKFSLILRIKTATEMDFLTEYNLMGLAIGLGTFLAIGVFHPIVIKAEYHFGTRCWWVFLLAGLGFMVCSVLVDDVLASSLLGVTAFSCFWSILELFQQQERVHKGWFPRNPRRRYPWDEHAENK